MLFNQRKQFNETNVTFHAFQQISNLKIFSECFRRPHAAGGPVVVPHGLDQSTLIQSSFCTLRALQACVKVWF